jgi:hypothetical protein
MITREQWHAFVRHVYDVSEVVGRSNVRINGEPVYKFEHDDRILVKSADGFYHTYRHPDSLNRSDLNLTQLYSAVTVRMSLLELRNFQGKNFKYVIDREADKELEAGLHVDAA